MNSNSASVLFVDEKLFNQVALIHVLVTFKELLLKCGLNIGISKWPKTSCFSHFEWVPPRNSLLCVQGYLKTNIGVEERLNQLLKRLEIILYLSHKKQETNSKLLELQQLLTTWIHNRTGNNFTDKVSALILLKLNIILKCFMFA